MEPMELKVEGMSCQHCVGAVTRALSKVPGVEKVEVSLEKKSARVWGRADRAALAAAVEQAGFSAA